MSRKSAFLQAFALCGSITAAAKAAKIERDMHYRWMKEDPQYPELFEDARRRAVDLLEEEAVKRARDGVFEPCTYKGEFVFPFTVVRKPLIDPSTGEQEKNAVTGALLFREERVYGKIPFGIWKKSDRLLEFLLRAGKPDKFRERSSVEVTGAAGGPIEIVERLQAGRARIAKTKDVNEHEPGA